MNNGFKQIDIGLKGDSFVVGVHFLIFKSFWLPVIDQSVQYLKPVENY